MARPIRNCERKKQVKVKKTSGVTYVYEKTVIYDPKKRYDKVLSSRLIGKIMPGSKDIVATRPKRAPSSRKADAEDKKPQMTEEIYRYHAGMLAILDYVGKASGIDSDLRTAITSAECDEPRVAELTVQRILSLVRYWIGTDGRPINGVEDWQKLHILPEELSEYTCHELFDYAGSTEQIVQQYGKLRSARLGSCDCIAFDSTTRSTYSLYTNHPEARFNPGMNKAHDGLACKKFLVLYSIESDQPLSFEEQPGNVPDVISIVNCIRNVKWLDLIKPTVVTDNGFYSESNLIEFLNSNIKCMMRVGVSDGKWIRDIINQNLDRLKHPDSILDTAGFERGIKISFTRKFTGRWVYNTAQHSKGESYTFERRLYLHLFYDPAKKAEDEKNLTCNLRELKRDIENGMYSMLTLSAQHRAARAFCLPRRIKGKRGSSLRRLSWKEGFLERALKYCGVFAILTNNARFNSEEALRIYRKRNRLESFFAKDKGHCDGMNERVHDRDTGRGRLFIQIVTLGYLEFLYGKLRDIRDEINRSLASGELDASGIKLYRSLRTWLDNNSLNQILLWFDCIDTIHFVRTDTEQYKRLTTCITTETTKRDRLFLKMLGMKSKDWPESDVEI